jgi:hypothetical protein
MDSDMVAPLHYQWLLSYHITIWVQMGTLFASAMIRISSISDHTYLKNLNDCISLLKM